MKSKEVLKEILGIGEYSSIGDELRGISEDDILNAMESYTALSVEAALKKVEDILEAERIAAVKLNSHAGSYAEQVLYNVIEEVRELYPTPSNI